MRMTAIADAAISYALGGIKIFPVHGITDGKCTCLKPDCTSAGKHPWTRNGYKDASSDIAKIKAWWTLHPNANVGAPTGSVNGFVVIDIDPRHGGNDSLDRLLELVGELPSTVMAHTGGGGRHIFFANPSVDLKNSVNTAGYQGIDFRGEGGLVVLPPSVHFSGGVYRWIKPLLEDSNE